MKRKKKVWVVEFEEPEDRLVFDDLEFGVLEVDEGGLAHWYYGSKTYWLEWKVLELKEVEVEGDENDEGN